VSATSSNALLRAHAVNRADGKVAVVLINEDPNNSTTVNVNVSNATLSSSGTEYTLGNASFPGGSSYATTGIQQSPASGLGNTFTVTVPAYTEYAILLAANGVTPAPTITSLSPNSGAAGSSVTISGTHFGASQGSSTVNFGGSLAVVSSWSDTSIAVKVPSLAAGPVNVTVSVGGASSNPASFTVTSGTCTQTRITPYVQVNGGAWQQTAIATVGSGSTVNLGPQPTGGTWSWSGPNGFTSAAREIDAIPLSAGANSFVATYTNASGCKSTQTFGITVSGTPPPSFTLSATSPALSIVQSKSGMDSIAVTDVNGFTGAVTLSVSGLPAGVTAAFGTNPTTGTSVLTLTASAAATPGPVTVTVTGTSGTLTASTGIALTIAPSGTSGFACHIGYSISNQWSGGFGAALTIANTGTVAISNWSLTWSFANGQTITQLWNANVAQSGANVTVTNASYNGSIPAGGSVGTVGFNGTWNNVTNAIPAAFAVNGTTCK
jgi:hypothetical protein